VADKRCENGHFIDESWDLCPYCPQDSVEPDIPVVRPARMQPEPPARPVSSRGPSTAVPPPSALASPRREPVPAGPPPPRRESPAPFEPPPMERTVAVQKIDVAGAAAAQPHRYVVGWLVGLAGDARGESYPVRMGRNVLGRDRRSDIVISDDQASSHHADLVFRPEEMRYILMDHNSTNGTYVNEAEIEPRRDLASGDVVRIGSQRFLFVSLCGEGNVWDSEGVLQ
jgi:FHA domain